MGAVARGGKFAAIVVFVALATVGLGAKAQVSIPGYALVDARFAVSATQRVIARVELPQPDILALGAVNVAAEMTTRLVDLATQLGVQDVERVASLDLVVFEVDAAQFDTLIRSGLIADVAPEETYRPSLASALTNVRGADAHTSGANGAGQFVVVVDTGVEADHPFLGGRVFDAVGACFSRNTSTARTSCPNGGSTQYGAGAAAPCDQLVEGCDHGTHVAGIIAGRDTLSSGTAPAARIIPINAASIERNGVGDCRDPDGCTTFYLADIARALSYVLNDLSLRFPIAAVNLSLGDDTQHVACPGHYLAPLIGQLLSRGIVTTIAAGNEQFTAGVAAPGCIPAALTVGATNDYNDTIAWFSNSSTVVDILAPGVNILSSIPGPGFYSKDGTSMAAPMVAGAVAALQSYYNASAHQIAGWLINPVNGVTVATLSPGVSRTRFDLTAALHALEAEIPSVSYVWMKDTWQDTGLPNDSNTAGRPMSESPDIWVRSGLTGLASEQECTQHSHEHQNPEFGNPNIVCVALRNSGSQALRGTVYVFQASANISNRASWSLVGTNVVQVAGRQTTIAPVIWANLPNPGHHCLVALWVPEGQMPDLDLAGGISAAVRANPGLIWRNVNIINAQVNTTTALVLEQNPGGTYNMVIEISRLDTNDLDELGQLILTLGGNPDDLNAEPTAIYYNHDGRYVSIPLRPGVYYIPDIRLPEDMDEAITTQLRFEWNDGVPESLRMEIRVSNIADVAAHKRGEGHGEAIGVTYVAVAGQMTLPGR